MRKISQKKIATAGVISMLIILVLLLTVPGLGAEGAIQINDVITECSVLGVDGEPDPQNPITASSTRLVVTDSQNENKTFKCEISDYVDDIDSAVTFNYGNTGKGCNVFWIYEGQQFFDFTNNWQQTISANGDLKLTCQFN